MTREEAIKAFRGLSGVLLPREYYREAIQMAIEALSREPSDDAVSRQAAIDVILDDKIGEKSLAIMRALGSENEAKSLNMACDRHVEFIKEIPSAQPEQRWIPVSERLPEENSDILVTYVEKDEKRIVPVNYGCGTWFDCLFDKVLNQVGVLAWMPLPEPWRGEQE